MCFHDDACWLSTTLDVHCFKSCFIVGGGGSKCVFRMMHAGCPSYF